MRGSSVLLGLMGMALGSTAVLAAPAPARSADCTLTGAPAAEAGLHAPFDRMLRQWVRDGRVDYRCFQANQALLDGYLAALNASNPDALSRSEALAFWINAYNAYTIKLILVRYPRLESIKDISRPWSRRDWGIGGRLHSLDDIEHEILRKRFGEPRIHFAIVCASFSCPKLASEAYAGGRIDEQLTRAARAFLADPQRGLRLDTAGDGGASTVHLSSIFKWFGEDFASKAGSPLSYVTPYLPAPEREGVQRQGRRVRVRFLPYDWTLNDAAR